MFRNSRGFLFIEGSIGLVAVVGILSAAIFPSMTGYLKRSRDAARMSHMKDIATSLGAYYADNERYPAEVISGCIPQELAPYMPRGIPVDPSPGKLTTGCDGSDGMTYAYRSPAIDTVAFFISADMEAPSNGNSYRSIDELFLDTSNLRDIQETFIRGSGQHYILSN